MPKRGGQTRLIMNTRIANSFFLDPPHTELLIRSASSRIELDEDTPLYLAEADIDTCFHRDKLPPGLPEYFALRSVKVR